MYVKLVSHPLRGCEIGGKRGKGERVLLLSAEGAQSLAAVRLPDGANSNLRLLGTFAFGQ